MNTKLTLRLNKNIISHMKNYADRRQRSLSKVTEDLFRQILIADDEQTRDLSPIVRKYKGIIKNRVENDRDDIISILELKH
jgi:hypothetical protein